MTRDTSERGSITPLVIGFGTVILLLIVVVIDASKAFLYQRALHAVADGAALAATNGIDTSAIYEGGIVDNRVILSRALAQEKVSEYMAGVQGMPGATCVVSDVQANQVTVDCAGTVKLPIASAALGGIGSVDVNAQASADTFANG
jgi:Flp pilus assembly protein TadG